MTINVLQFFKKIILALSFSILYHFSFSQNLIPNPSFEDENICIKYHENCSPSAWRSTTLKQFLYPEYLAHQRESTAIRPPEGTRFIGLRLFNTKRKSDRSIVQVPLLCKLEKGKEYQLKFDYLSSIFWINSFHIQFVDSLKIYKNNEPILKNESQITIEFQQPHQSKKWLTYETVYKATGDEVGIILGNLKSDELTQVTLFEKRKHKDKRRAYYYFDNFYLLPIEQDSICNLDENRKFIYQDSIRHHPNGKILDIRMMEPKPKEIVLPQLPKEIPSTPIKITPPPPPPTEITTERIFTMKNILFETNSEKLLPIAHSSLQKLVSFLNKNADLNVLIIGHTDNIGNEKANLILSEKRAQSVGDFLILNNIPPNRIKTIGKGESQPVTTNDTPEGRSQNRRVEFQLVDP